MRAEYSGDWPRSIRIDAPASMVLDHFEITLDEARELYESLPNAMLEAEEARPLIFPCPFCGGEGQLIRYNLVPHVMCNGCRATGPSTSTWQEAVEGWNRRAEP